MRPDEVLSRALKRAHQQVREDEQPSLHGLPPDVKAIIADQLPLRSVISLHDTTSAHRGEFRQTQARAFGLMWGLSNPIVALRLAAHPALAALVGQHPIVVAGTEGWRTTAYSDRVTDGQLLAWAAANGGSGLEPRPCQYPSDRCSCSGLCLKVTMAADSRRSGNFSRRMLSSVGIPALLNTLAAIPSREMPGIDEIGSHIVIHGRPSWLHCGEIREACTGGEPLSLRSRLPDSLQHVFR
jgi:hypothetical protein